MFTQLNKVNNQLLAYITFHTFNFLIYTQGLHFNHMQFNFKINFIIP